MPVQTSALSAAASTARTPVRPSRNRSVSEVGTSALKEWPAPAGRSVPEPSRSAAHSSASLAGPSRRAGTQRSSPDQFRQGSGCPGDQSGSVGPGARARRQRSRADAGRERRAQQLAPRESAGLHGGSPAMYATSARSSASEHSPQVPSGGMPR